MVAPIFTFTSLHLHINNLTEKKTLDEIFYFLVLHNIFFYMKLLLPIQ